VDESPRRLQTDYPLPVQWNKNDKCRAKAIIRAKIRQSTDDSNVVTEACIKKIVSSVHVVVQLTSDHSPIPRNQSINQSIKYYIILRQKVDQRAGQLYLPHVAE